METAVTQYPDYGVAAEYQLSPAFWLFAKQFIPLPQQRTKRGKPRVSDHKCMTAILYVLRTGGQWAALPKSLGAKSTMHDRFQEWRKAGVFENIWTAAVELLDYLEVLDLEWQSVDGALVKAPLGGEKNGQKSDRPRQAGLQAKFVGRSQRNTDRTRDSRSQQARYETAWSNA
jgi:transposase